MSIRAGVCVVLCGVVLLFSITALAADYMDGFEAGREAAQADHSGLAQFTGGFFLGIFYVGYALLAPSPGPPTWRLQNINTRSDEYQRGFMEGYVKMWRSKRSMNALSGMLTGYAALYVFYIALAASYY